MSTTTEKTDISTLVQYQGHPVPWVTRWSGERPDDDRRQVRPGFDQDGTLWVRYAEEPENEEREANGILWQREGVTRGGRPHFAEVNTYRQRAAMRKRRCQVCGKKITTPVITWLMAEGHLDISEYGVLSMNPPTCDACVPVALEICPHLTAHGAQVLKVLEYELWGAYGDQVYLTWQDNIPTPHLQRLNLAYDPELRPRAAAPTAFVAKQQIVKLTKFKRVDL